MESQRRRPMDRLAELRERHALTLRDLAEMSGVAADTINQIELGHRKARPSTLRKLARALDVEVREFFEEPTLSGKAEAPETGQDVQEASASDIARDAARRQVEQTSKALNRLEASQGIPQTGFVHAYNEAVQVLSKRFSDELAQALLEAEEAKLWKDRQLAEKEREIEALRERVGHLEQSQVNH
jgi:transcriptional regulator with XRE-family HTH domain